MPPTFGKIAYILPTFAQNKKARYRLNSRLSLYIWWLGAESNCRHADFQSEQMGISLYMQPLINYIKINNLRQLLSK